MRNKIVYCEFAFLMDFLKSCPMHNDNPLEGDDPVLSWIKVYRFLSCSETRLDISKEQYREAALKDKDLMKSFKACTNMYFCDKDFAFKKGQQKLFGKDELHSVYMTTRNRLERAKLATSLGILVIGKQDINKFVELYKDRTVVIPKGDAYTSWDDVEFPEQAKISNSMIIVDNYILDDTNQISINIGSLLDKLLPETTETVYHIFIYGMFKGTSKSKTESDAQRRYDLINEEVKQRRPNLNHKLSILDTKDFHDRIIVTNNVWIDCGAGFDLFKKGRACKRTNIRFAFPFMLEGLQQKYWANEAFAYLIEDCIKIERKEHTYKFDFWGEQPRENRLIEYYKNELNGSK